MARFSPTHVSHIHASAGGFPLSDRAPRRTIGRKVEAFMTVHVETEGAVAIVTIDRPDTANAIDGPTAQALAAAFRRFDADDTLRVAVLTGANNRFCAGNDLKSM